MNNPTQPGIDPLTEELITLLERAIAGINKVNALLKAIEEEYKLPKSDPTESNE